MAIWDPTAKFNFRQYFWLYGMLSKLTYMAGKSEEILSLSFAKEKDAKEVVSQQNHVGEDESGDEVFFTSGI